MNKYPVYSDQAPTAIGPYSQAIRVRQFLYTSGQIALDPKTGIILGSSIEKETEQVLNNLKAILTADGLSLANVIKTNVYMVDMKEFEQMNMVYEKFFEPHKPARACVQVAALPKEARLEIDVIAFAE
tara:strand:- start:3966 stop:4349 length:384 start_codon:yes stop_codon:yes gene_type:complete